MPLVLLQTCRTAPKLQATCTQELAHSFDLQPIEDLQLSKAGVSSHHMCLAGSKLSIVAEKVSMTRFDRGHSEKSLVLFETLEQAIDSSDSAI